MEREEFTDPTTILPVATLDDLITTLKKVFSEDRNRVNIEYVKTLMESYKSNPREWRKYAHFDANRYTRNLVDEGNGHFNLLILCWGPNQGSSIHSHAGSHCFLKVLDGEMSETAYDWPIDDTPTEEVSPDTVAKPMQEKCQMRVQRDEVTYINDDMGLHRMENPSHSEGAVTLHLYSPPFMQCYTFDERSAKRGNATMTFWSRYGARTPFTPICAQQAENN